MKYLYKHHQLNPSASLIIVLINLLHKFTKFWYFYCFPNFAFNFFFIWCSLLCESKLEISI